MISDMATVSFSDTGYLIAHIAGAVTGFLFIFFLRKGFDGSKWMNNFFDWKTFFADTDVLYTTSVLFLIECVKKC